MNSKFSYLIAFFMILTISFASGSVHLPPKMVTAADDMSYLLDSTGNELVWQFIAEESNDEPSHYTVTIDGSDLTGHTLVSWDDGVDIVVNVDGFALGSYNVKISVNDTGTDNGQAAATEDTAVVNVVEDLSTVSTTPSASSSNTDTAPFFLPGLLALLIRRKR
jgi:hypothetical protein